MSPTLPGDIPGLLRRGSPVVSLTGSVGVVSLDPGAYAAYYLDLSDATGRAHAAWWVSSTASLQRPRGWLLQIDAALGAGHFYAVIDAGCGLPLTDERIDRLRRAVLYLAGRPL